MEHFVIMSRTFHPIGQGGFHSEQFEYSKDTINIIYDCGSATSIDTLKDEINNTFKKNTTIHALFISHFHSDHVNGIPHLLQHCKVEKIFFPLLSEDNKLLLKIKAFIEDHSDDFTYNFINNPSGAIKELFSNENSPKLIPVKEDEFNENIENNSESITSHPSGEDVLNKISTDKFNWVFIPYNFKQEERFEELKKKLNEEFKVELKKYPNHSIEDFLQDFLKTKGNKNIISRLRKVYESISGNPNSNSMTLYSGPEKKYSTGNYLNIETYIRSMCIKTDKFACLYTGDYNASNYNFQSLREKYKEYWGFIHTIQVPHHGSKANFNDSLIDKDRFLIISAGLNNKYRHPDSTILKSILLNGGIPLIVTENEDSKCKKVWFYVN